MTDTIEPEPTPAPEEAAPEAVEESAAAAKTQAAGLFALRRPLPKWQSAAIGILSILVLLALWWMATAGAPEERMISPTALPSPAETFDSFSELWFDRALTRNTFVTLRRVLLGFLLASLVGIPLGILCG